MTADTCPCGRSPDPGVRPGGGCYCADLPHCEHGWTVGFEECPECIEAERTRYCAALEARLAEMTEAAREAEHHASQLIEIGAQLPGYRPTKDALVRLRAVLGEQGR